MVLTVFILKATAILLLVATIPTAAVSIAIMAAMEAMRCTKTAPPTSVCHTISLDRWTAFILIENWCSTKQRITGRAASISSPIHGSLLEKNLLTGAVMCITTTILVCPGPIAPLPSRIFRETNCIRLPPIAMATSISATSTSMWHQNAKCLLHFQILLPIPQMP